MPRIAADRDQGTGTPLSALAFLRDTRLVRVCPSSPPPSAHADVHLCRAMMVSSPARCPILYTPANLGYSGPRPRSGVQRGERTHSCDGRLVRDKQ